MRLRRKGTSWRPLTTPDQSDFFRQYDCVIATDVYGQGRRGNTYEVYTFGQIVAERPTLASAKTYVEDTYGKLVWKRVTLDKEMAVHYYFGPTTEFTDPLTIWVVERLPRL